MVNHSIPRNWETSNAVPCFAGKMGCIGMFDQLRTIETCGCLTGSLYASASQRDTYPYCAELHTSNLTVTAQRILCEQVCIHIRCCQSGCLSVCLKRMAVCHHIIEQHLSLLCRTEWNQYECDGRADSMWTGLYIHPSIYSAQKRKLSALEEGQNFPPMAKSQFSGF